MKLLNLRGNIIGNAGACFLSECIHNIDHLNLNTCALTEEGVNALAEQIKKRDTPVY